MKTFDFNNFLAKNNIHVFTLDDTARILAKDKHYSAIFLARDKWIKKAIRGIYYTPEASIYEIATSIISQSYVSLISALRFYNLTEQIPNTVYVISKKQHKGIELNGTRIEFLKVKPSLMYGYAKVDDAFVADPEKAVVDMLYLGRFEEYALEAIESGKLDNEKLKRYAELSGSKKIMQIVQKVVSEITEEPDRMGQQTLSRAKSGLRYNLLIAIKPKWAEQILNGNKKWEYRRVAVHAEEGSKLILYASGPLHAIVGEATIEKVLIEPIDLLIQHTVKEVPETAEELRRYFEGKKIGCAIKVANPIRYANQITLEDIRKEIPDFKPPQSFYYVLDGTPLMKALYRRLIEKAIGKDDLDKRFEPAKALLSNMSSDELEIVAGLLFLMQEKGLDENEAELKLRELKPQLKLEDIWRGTNTIKKLFLTSELRDKIMSELKDELDAWDTALNASLKGLE